MRTIIGLHGLPRSGKDTVARILISTKRFERLAFADPLKEAAAILLNRPVGQCHGLDVGGVPYDREQVMPEWGFSMRWFLQVFGTECMRNQIAEDFWTRRMAAAIASSPPDARLVITDVRFDNETNFLRRMGAQIVEVYRPGLVRSGHSSDQPVSCDWVLVNNGTLDDLFRTVINERRFAS